MKKYKVLVFIIFLNCFLSAQLNWYNPKPQGNKLTDIYFSDSSNGIAVGSNGTVLKTTNGGIIWNNYPLASKDNFKKIYFIDANNGWAIVENKTQLLKSSNSGLNWNIISTLSGSAIIDFQFVDNLIGYAITDSSTKKLYKTTDGGYNWNIINIVQSVVPSSVFFLDEMTGYISAVNSIYKTTNGGQNWNLLSLNTSNLDINKIFFVNTNDGFISGKQKNIGGDDIYLFLSTSNGGLTWLSKEFEGEITDIHFASRDSGWISVLFANSHKIYKTSNHCQFWTLVNASATAFHFYNKQKAWGITSGNLITITNDGWESSVRQTPSVVIQDLFRVTALDSNLIYTVGGKQNIVATSNGGESWRNFACSCTELKSYGVYIKNDKEVWVVGSGGAVLITEDRGETWNDIYLPTPDLRDIIFVNNATGFIIGDSVDHSVIYKTTNSGGDWLPLHNFTLTPAVRLLFSGDNIGWFAAGNKIFKSTDYGLIWNNIYTSVENITDISTSDNIVFCASGNKIYKTTNEGISWITTTLRSDSIKIKTISFANSNDGLAGCSDGKIFLTSNGGINWIELNQITNQSINSLILLNRNNGWIVGSNGIILHFDGNNLLNVTDYQDSRNKSFALEQNFPNPFNPSTKIYFKLNKKEHIRLKIFDVLGNEIITLVDEEKDAGSYSVDFLSNSRTISSGIYFYTLQNSSNSITKKMILLK